MVLIIGPLPDPVNGCSLANQVLVNRLLSSGVEFEVINMSAPIQPSDSMGKFSFRKVASHIQAYREISRIKNANVVYSTPGQTFWGILKYAPFYLYCQLRKIPYVVHIHGNHLGSEFRKSGRLRKTVIKLCLGGAAQGIVLSESLRPNFNNLIDPSKVKVVENFVQDYIIPSELPRKDYSKLRLLFLSNLMKEKGFIDFIQALRILKQRNVPFSANIAGKPENERDQEILAEFSDLKEEICYHGIVSGENKKQLLLESNVFVLPTYYRMEGQPITLIEAMANGNIVVTTRFSGIPDIVSELNGFFVSPKAPAELADILTSISEDLEKLVSRMSAQNYKYARARFQENLFSSKILSILDHVSRSEGVQTS